MNSYLCYSHHIFFLEDLPESDICSLIWRPHTFNWPLLPVGESYSGCSYSPERRYKIRPKVKCRTASFWWLFCCFEKIYKYVNFRIFGLHPVNSLRNDKTQRLFVEGLLLQGLPISSSRGDSWTNPDSLVLSTWSLVWQAVICLNRTD